MSSVNPSPSAPRTEVTGGCLCQRIRYRAVVDKLEGYYCHCRMCQLAFGNTRAAFINVKQVDVTWTGADKPKTFASSRMALRGFCGHCGTPLTFAYQDSERMDVSVGSLDDPAQFKPTSHFATESKVANWHVDDGLSGMRLDEYAPIVSRWKQAYGDDAVPGNDLARASAGSKP